MEDSDIELSYREEGSGTPFILLHGNGESSAYFEHQIGHFSRKYHVYAIDTRGHGRSQRGTAPFTIGQFARDLYAFLMGRHIRRAVILGFSDGSNIAMKLAIRHPEVVQALILDGGNLHPEDVRRAVQLPIEAGYRIAKCFASVSRAAKRRAEMLGLMVNDPFIEPSDLAAISAPTLVICGTRDVIREAHTRKIAENIPGARMVILKGNHFVANRHPEAFNQAVDDFLKTAGA